mmetsp:Transcript_67032/g.187429  ORF Transcript_67032/g.187429 Transcript_67032/m.187429 type:complete len:688 (-) Transcript_67032:173-2236(-)
MFGSNSPRNGGVGGGSYYHGIQMLGLMNAIKTGDATIDTLIAMSLPVILTKVVEQLSGSRRGGNNGNYVYNEQTWWSRLRFFSKRQYRRTISHTNRTNLNSGVTGCGSDEDSYNSFLIKSIQLYIHEHCHFDPVELNLELTDALSSNNNNRTAGDLQYQKALSRKLGIQIPAKSRHQLLGNPNVGTNNSSASTYGMLQNCSIIQKPVHNKWHDLGAFDGKPVHLWISESTSGGGSSSKQRNSEDGDESVPHRSIDLLLRSEGPTSVDTFVQKAYSWYMSELAKEQCDDRFFYDLKGFEGRGSHRYPVFGKYKLSDEKTFKSLFSRKCHDLLKLIDQFQNKSGKYGIPGYPHKLGLLLHGPPGTGKTSLIKAVAHETKRHIVNVPLSRIDTNNELMTLIFNQRYTVAGQGANATPKMDFDQVIFCFEDIDAATEVVKRREDPLTKHTSEEVPASVPTSWTPSPPPNGNTYTSSSSNLPTGNVVGGYGFATSGSRLRDAREVYKASGTGDPTPTSRLDDDRLNLMGMLNVLDGVVDTPGRMIIMTSNHPEVLDPALIRPGRIDKKLELGYMESPDVVAMLEHYYQTKLSATDQDRVHRSVNGGGEASGVPLKLIPARVEQLAMEEETIEAMIAWLEAEREELCTTSGTSKTKKSGALKSKPSNVTADTEEFSSIGTTSSSERSCEESMD